MKFNDNDYVVAKRTLLYWLNKNLINEDVKIYYHKYGSVKALFNDSELLLLNEAKDFMHYNVSNIISKISRNINHVIFYPVNYSHNDFPITTINYKDSEFEVVWGLVNGRQIDVDDFEQIPELFTISFNGIDITGEPAFCDIVADISNNLEKYINKE